MEVKKGMISRILRPIREQGALFTFLVLMSCVVIPVMCYATGAFPKPFVFSLPIFDCYLITVVASLLANTIFINSKFLDSLEPRRTDKVRSKNKDGVLFFILHSLFFILYFFVWIFAFLLLGGEVLSLLCYQSPYSMTVLQLLLETNVRETTEFLQGHGVALQFGLATAITAACLAASLIINSWMLHQGGFLHALAERRNVSCGGSRGTKLINSKFLDSLEPRRTDKVRSKNKDGVLFFILHSLFFILYFFVWIFAFLLLGGEVLSLLCYQSPYSMTVLQLLLETNVRETTEFLQGHGVALQFGLATAITAACLAASLIINSWMLHQGGFLHALAERRNVSCGGSRGASFTSIFTSTLTSETSVSLVVSYYSSGCWPS